MSGFSEFRRLTPGFVMFVAAVVLAVSATVVHGQIELAAIQGAVSDEEGNPLEGVAVHLRDLERGRVVDLESDDEGRFYRRGLRATEYEITVEKAGYRPLQDRIDLAAGRDQRFSFTLVAMAPAGAEEFTSGVEAFNRGDNEAAAQAFEAALEKAPGLPEVHVNLGLAYFRLGRTAEAVAQLESAAALAPDNPTVQFQLGSAYVEMQNLDKAVTALERGLALQPDLTDSLAYGGTVTLGAVYFAQGDNDSAITAFEKALAVKSEPAPMLGLAKALFSAGETDRALEIFQAIVASAPGSPEAVEAQAFIDQLEPGGSGS